MARAGGESHWEKSSSSSIFTYSCYAI